MFCEDAYDALCSIGILSSFQNLENARDWLHRTARPRRRGSGSRQPVQLEHRLTTRQSWSLVHCIRSRPGTTALEIPPRRIPDDEGLRPAETTASRV